MTKKNAGPSPNGWRTAEVVSDWSFTFATSSVSGHHAMIWVRLIENNAVTGMDVVRIRTDWRRPAGES